MQDQRLTGRLLKHWNLVRKSDVFPRVQKLNPAAIEDLWPHCFLVSIISQPRISYKYDYMGEFVIAMYGRDLTGLHVDERMHQFPGAVIFKALGAVVEECRPKDDDGYFVNEAGKLVKYRACFLPFGDSKKGMTHIVAGLSCRMF